MRILYAIGIVGLMLAASFSMLVSPASANYVHPRGILMTIYPQDESQYMVFISPGVYTRTVAVVILPPWYFVEGLMGFDTVTATLTLDPNCYQCVQYTSGPPPILGALSGTGQWNVADRYQSEGQRVSGSGSELTAQWSNVQMTEENNGALLTFTFTITIEVGTGYGYYMMYMNGEANAPGVTFTGFDQWGVSYNAI